MHYTDQLYTVFWGEMNTADEDVQGMLIQRKRSLAPSGQRSIYASILFPGVANQVS